MARKSPTQDGNIGKKGKPALDAKASTAYAPKSTAKLHGNQMSDDARSGDAGAKDQEHVQDYEEYVNAVRQHIQSGQSEEMKTSAYRHRRNNSVVFEEAVPAMKSTFLQTSTQAQLRQFPVCVHQGSAKAAPPSGPREALAQLENRGQTNSSTQGMSASVSLPK